MTQASIKGWCPGALRPMESGDGLIVRLKITGGIVPLNLAEKIADWSARWGNGEIHLTSRANLQLRGVTAKSLLDLQQAMAIAGLLDADADGEAVRNVIASPLAGLDPDAILDIRPLVAKLEARLAGDPALHKLPAKFCFAVDDGGRLSLGDVRADVRFEALATVDGPILAIFSDGSEDRRDGSCDPDKIAEVAAFMGSFFLVHRERSKQDIPRMRDLVAVCGTGKSAHRKGYGPKSRSAGAQPDQSVGVLGIHSFGKRASPNEGEPMAYLGIGLPFGRIAAKELAKVAKHAALCSASELRLTPWRAILVPTQIAESANDLAHILAGDALILDPADPRRRVAACVGTPACPNATTDVRSDAGQLAAFVADGAFLHVSGCAKGCAHPRSAPVTLVGRDGRYDVVHNGAPSDSPVLRALTLDEAAEHLRQMTAQHSQGGTA